MQRFHNTFSVAFYCRPSKKNSEGLSPVEIAINVGGERVFVNTSIRYSPERFAKDTGRRKSNELKERLAVIERRMRAYETECLADGEAPSAAGARDFVRNGYRRPGKSLDDMFAAFFSHLGKRVEAGRVSGGVYRKYENVRDLFMRETGLDGGMAASRVAPGAVADFCVWLDGHYRNSSAAGMKTKLKSMLAYGKDNGYMATNPFQGRIEKEEVRVVPLTREEVEAIRDKDLSALPRLERVRDLFVFSCYTGLAFVDTQRLEPGDILQKGDTYYINKARAKTKVPFVVPLLPEALDILRRYEWRLPRLSNQKTNSYLAEIEAITGIGKHLHFHLARHTAACMFLNDYKLSTEVTAKVLGHANIKITQHYAKVWGETVLEAFKGL